MDVIDKYTGRSMGSVPTATEDDVRAAVAKAEAAFPGWADTPAHRRAAILSAAAKMHGAAVDDSGDHNYHGSNQNMNQH